MYNNIMKYYRIMPGGKSAHLNDCLKGEFIGKCSSFNSAISKPRK